MARSCSNRHFRASLRSQALPAPQGATEGLARGARFEYSETSRAGFVELAPDRLLTEQEFYDALKKGWLAGGVIKNGMVNLGVAPVMVRTMMVGRQGGCAMLQALPEPVRKWMRCAGRLPGTA